MAFGTLVSVKLQSTSSPAPTVTVAFAWARFLLQVCAPSHTKSVRDHLSGASVGTVSVTTTWVPGAMPV